MEQGPAFARISGEVSITLGMRRVITRRTRRNVERTLGDYEDAADEDDVDDEEPEEEGVEVVLHVGHPLTARLRGALQPHHQLHQVLEVGIKSGLKRA